jgi:hypothetical protein
MSGLSPLVLGFFMTVAAILSRWEAGGLDELAIVGLQV